MPREVALQGLEIAFLNVVKHKDRHLWVDFVGGETLLSFEFVEALSDYIEVESERRRITVTYSLTTNGSILTPAILRWMIRKRVHIKLSIDGDEAVHDKNRHCKDGQGSYCRIIETLPYFKEYERESGISIQVTHVLTRNNYAAAFLSVRHLVENLGFKIVDSALDVTVRWKQEEMDCLSQEWEKTLKYYIQRKRQGNPFLWGIVVDMQHYSSKQTNADFCGVGLTKIYVKTDGNIYGCAANLESTGLLGNVGVGISIKQVKNYRETILKSNNCTKCEVKCRCLAKGCIMNNLSYSGCVDIPNPMLCYLEKKKQGLWDQYYIELQF